jgi:hypothetical protein
MNQNDTGTSKLTSVKETRCEFVYKPFPNYGFNAFLKIALKFGNQLPIDLYAIN